MSRLREGLIRLLTAGYILYSPARIAVDPAYRRRYCRLPWNRQWGPCRDGR